MIRLNENERAIVSQAIAAFTWWGREEQVRLNEILLRNKRRNMEKALVALVNAVPEWADPVAWRAAVLAYVEFLTNEDISRLEARFGDWLRARLTLPFDDSMGALPAQVTATVAAYRRAFEKPKPVRPERKRSPGLPLDCDWD